MKKKISIITVISIVVMFTQQIYAEKPSITLQGKEPEIDREEVEERYYRTHKAVQSPFSFKIVRYVEEENKAFLSPKKDGKTQIDLKAFIQHKRIFLVNPGNETFDDIYFVFEYFYYKYPPDELAGSSTRFRKEPKNKTDQPRTRLYDMKIFKMPSLKPKINLTIDFPDFNIFIGGSQTSAKEHILIRENGSFYKIKAIREYAGFVFSVFSKSKLLYQATNNKELQEKGIDKLTLDLLNNYLVK